MTRLLLAALLLTGCATPPLLPSACCWRVDAQVHGWCDVPNTDEVCGRKVEDGSMSRVEITGPLHIDTVFYPLNQREAGK